MKHTPRKLLSAFLALTLAFSLLPMTAAAEEDSTVAPSRPTNLEEAKACVEVHYETDKQYIQYENETYESYLERVSSWYQREVGNTDYAAFVAWLQGHADKLYGRAPAAVVHVHAWSPAYTRTSHFLLCSCEERRNTQAHIHGEAECPCGYEFSTNAQLTTLWVEGMRLTQPFDPEVTAYTATPVDYKDVTKTRITAFPFDALATVTLSEDLTVKEGTNTYTVEVTAEDGVTTNTYTITVTK